MHIDRSWLNLGQSLAVTLALVGCGDSSGASPTAATTASATAGSGSVAASRQAVSPTVASPTVASPTGASQPRSSSGSVGTGAATNILFQQPQESGITDHLLVPTATHKSPSKGT